MGADIHLVLEKRVLPPGYMPGAEQWVGVNAFPYVTTEVYDFSQRIKQGKADAEVVYQGNTHWPPTSRNYNLFADIAGVRGPGPEARGVPDDVSLLAAHMIARWDADGHSHTWLTMDEALPLFIRHRQFGDPGEAVKEALKKGTAAAVEQYMRYFWGMDDDDTLADFRLIAWFDN